jgi:hypothetical protein
VILATLEAEIWRIAVRDQPRQKSAQEPISTNGCTWWHTLVILAIQGNINSRITVRAEPCIKQDSIAKITSIKRTGVMAQVLHNLPKKAQGPKFNHYTTKKKNMTEKKKVNSSAPLFTRHK